MRWSTFFREMEPQLSDDADSVPVGATLYLEEGVPPIRFVRVTGTAELIFGKGAVLAPAGLFYVMQEELSLAQAASLLRTLDEQGQSAQGVLRRHYQDTWLLDDFAVSDYLADLSHPYIVVSWSLAAEVIQNIALRSRVPVAVPSASEWYAAFRSDSNQPFPWSGTWEDRPSSLSTPSPESPLSLLAPSANQWTSPSGVRGMLGNVAEMIEFTVSDRMQIRRAVLTRAQSDDSTSKELLSLYFGWGGVWEFGFASTGGSVLQEPEQTRQLLTDLHWLVGRQWIDVPHDLVGLRLVIRTKVPILPEGKVEKE